MVIESDQLGSSAPAPRLISAHSLGHSEESAERALRPKKLQDYTGQHKVRAQLEIFIAAAKQRREALDHVLLFGPPGLGKTTLAHIIAQELEVQLKQTSGPILERLGDLAEILISLESNEFLFIDHIYRLLLEV